MEIFLLRTPGGHIVARTSPTQLVDGSEGSYTQVAKINIKSEGRLTADNPDLQALLCDAFTEGARWQKKNPRNKVKEW